MTPEEALGASMDYTAKTVEGAGAIKGDKGDKGDAGATVVVDANLSTTSENPVQNKVVTTALNSKVNNSDIGTASGVAELDENGKVPSNQLPSFVDDVVEGYYKLANDRFYKESTFETLIAPESGKSWVDVATNKSYRWTGNVYVRVDEGVQLGETSSTAYRGDRGKTAYDDSQTNKANIGTLANLNTTAKTSLVNAINELYTSMASAGGGFAPIGSIISYMGATPPADYLACNGQTLNISEYTELATHFETQFGSKNFFGGDGTTTFAVPDLRGEFLRGTGTNGHANQGSGANVGAHQDATVHVGTPLGQLKADGKLLVMFPINESYVSGSSDATANYYKEVNVDKTWGRTRQAQSSSLSMSDASGTWSGQYTSRPTNTSVLYCIKYTNSAEVPHKYSTSERVVGTWIDGKTVYEKTNTFTLPTVTSGSLIDYGALSASNVDEIINVECMVDIQVGNYTVSVPVFGAYGVTANKDLGDTICWAINKHNTNKDMSLRINTATSQFSEATGKVTVRYTKTTD